jgi:hypothetical protein
MQKYYGRISDFHKLLDLVAKKSAIDSKGKHFQAVKDLKRRFQEWRKTRISEKMEAGAPAPAAAPEEESWTTEGVLDLPQGWSILDALPVPTAPGLIKSDLLRHRCWYKIEILN